jgi:hypothetical protein
MVAPWMRSRSAAIFTSGTRRANLAARPAADFHLVDRVGLEFDEHLEGGSAQIENERFASAFWSGLGRLEAESNPVRGHDPLKVIGHNRDSQLRHGRY